MDMMIDLETLGTSPNARIIQIGAVMFEARDRGKIRNGTGFRQNVNDPLGVVDQDTVAWWMTQPQASRILRQPSVPMALGLAALNEWVMQEGYDWEALDTIWACPATFDLPALHSAYLRYGAPRCPWDHRAQRCGMTLFRLVGGAPEIDWTGLTHHDGLDDAIGQAQQVQKALAQLGL